MGKYKRILSAFDGSDSARNALNQAIELARTEKSWIKVVSVIPSYAGDLDLTGVRDIGRAIKGPAEKLLSQAREVADAKGVAVITNIEEGEAYERIVDVADAENCDVIVMGRKGHGRLEKALMGCVTERVIGYTQKDVLVVPGQASLSWNTLLVPTDGSEYSLKAMREAVQFAKAYGGSIVGISVVDTNDEFDAMAPGLLDQMLKAAWKSVNALGEIAKDAGVPYEGLVREGDVTGTIIDTASERSAGLIVIGSHGRKGISRLLMGSETRKVIGLSSCPVLVVGRQTT